jgi:hypothetical protein
MSRYVGEMVSESDIVAHVAAILGEMPDLVPDFKVEVVKEDPEMEIIREIHEEPLDPSIITLSITARMPVIVDQIFMKFNLPDGTIINEE